MSVRILPVALRDIGSIYDWLSMRSADAANRVEATIFETIDFWGEHPGSGESTNERHVHRWPMTQYPYTIFYRVRRINNFIEILRVVHGKRVRNLKRVPRR